MENNQFGFDRFSDNAKKILMNSQGIARDMGSRIIDTEHVLLAVLSEKSLAEELLASFGIDFDRIELAINFVPLENIHSSKDAGISLNVKKSLETAILVAKNNGHFYVGSEHILYGIISDPSFKAYILIQNVDVNPESIKKNLEGVFANLPKGEINKEGAFMGGGTQQKEKKESILSQYATDLTAEAVLKKLDPVVGREKEIERIIHILSRRTKNNPVLIGDPGVGKTAIVEGLASRIVNGETPIKLKNKRVYSLDLGAMIAGTKFRGEFEERVKKLLAEAEKDKNIILFIDEIHTIIGAGSAEGSMDASNMLKPALARGKITCIGATTVEEYRKNIEKDAAFERRLQPVFIEEPSIEDTIEILKGVAQNYEDFHGVLIEPEAIKLAANLSQRYITDRFLPDKAIDVIDEASSAVVIKEKIGESDEVKELELKLKNTIEGKNKAIEDQKFELAAELRDQEIYIREEIEKLQSAKDNTPREKRTRVTEQDIARVVNSWTGVPITRLIDSEKSKFLSLEKILKEKIVGQEEAISTIATAIRRGRSGIGNPKRPIGSFIFLGPTGVGKTELVKVLASEIYDNENALIKIDMSEFMEKHNVSRLIGAPAGYVGYEDGGKLTEAVRKKPYSVVLFDEIEKAHPEVFNLLLQILEDGYLTDSKGRKVDFRNTVIILTSNIGVNEFTQVASLGFKMGDTDAEELSDKYEGMKKTVLEQIKRKFSPEFLNRIDKTIVFKPLGKSEIEEIVKIGLSDLQKRVLKEKNIKISFAKRLVSHIAKEGYDPEYGARPIRRLIENEIENAIAERIISGEIGEGEEVKIDFINGVVSFEKKKELARR